MARVRRPVKGRFLHGKEKMLNTLFASILTNYKVLERHREVNEAIKLILELTTLSSHPLPLRDNLLILKEPNSSQKIKRKV